MEVWIILRQRKVDLLTGLLHTIMENERMPEEWRSDSVPIFQNYVQICSNCKGLTLMSHTMKPWERLVEPWLNREVTVTE